VTSLIANGYQSRGHWREERSPQVRSPSSSAADEIAPSGPARVLTGLTAEVEAGNATEPVH
jgi:hypothetical protein